MGAPDSTHVPADLQEALFSVHRIVTADPRDWSADRHDAFLYAVFRGWPADEEGAVAARHGWDAAFVRRLHRLHSAVTAALP